METTCQSSYPLKSENARPFGTCNVYLSAATAMPPKATSTTELIATALTRIVEMRDIKSLLVWGPEDSRPRLKMGRIIPIAMRRRRTLNAPDQITFPWFCERHRTLQEDSLVSRRGLPIPRELWIVVAVATQASARQAVASMQESGRLTSLRTILAEYVAYFNKRRPHRSIGQRAPCSDNAGLPERHSGGDASAGRAASRLLDSCMTEPISILR